jgi:hypothetical protein
MLTTSTGAESGVNSDTSTAAVSSATPIPSGGQPGTTSRTSAILSSILSSSTEGPTSSVISTGNESETRTSKSSSTTQIYTSASTVAVTTPTGTGGGGPLRPGVAGMVGFLGVAILL